MRYPGTVRCSNPDQYVTLATAVKKIMKFKSVFCKCVTSGYQTKHCKCFVAKLKCSSRCHKSNTANCKNREEEITTRNETSVKLSSCVSSFVPVFPSFGGSINFNGSLHYFHNTCPVDTWLAVFKVLQINCKLRDNVNEEFNKLMLFVRKDQYSATKFMVAISNKIVSRKNSFNFYGSEFTLFIQHFLLFHMCYIEESSCLFCPQKRSVREMSNVPTLEFHSTAATDWISPDEFQRQIVS